MDNKGGRIMPVYESEKKEETRVISRRVPVEMYERFTKEIDNWEEEEKRKAEWTCGICGESTYNIDFDYLIGYDHMPCALDLETALSA